MQTWTAFLIERLPELWRHLGEHLVLTGVSTALAIAIGIPAAILACRSPASKGVILTSVSILQTVPSLALLTLLLAVLGKIGALPATIALTLYALLPIVRNTIIGIEGVPDGIRQAAEGLGMTSWQRLWKVELPLAVPVIMAGIRTATVISVGIATLAAFIGAGGLGEFINRGLYLANYRLILLVRFQPRCWRWRSTRPWVPWAGPSTPCALLATRKPTASRPDPLPSCCR